MIELRGVQTNNLKNIDVQFPPGKLSVVTGVSGSGKSSLVFDSLYAEAYRRYVESLSSFARQYLAALPKPVIREVKSLPAAVAVRQSRSGATHRSTVGTLTEIADLLRILFAHHCEVFCRQCGHRVRRESPQSLWSLLSKKPGRAMIGAPLSVYSEMNAKTVREFLLAQGFERLRLKDGSFSSPQEASAESLKSASVIVDRIQIRSEERARAVDALGIAFKLGRGRVEIYFEQEPVQRFAANWHCANCGTEHREPTESLFSYNHPLGACSACQGFGRTSELDWTKIIPDKESSLSEKGIECWNFGQHAEMYDYAKTSAKRRKLPFTKPFSQYSKEDMEWLVNGDGEYEGIKGYFDYLHRKRYKAHYRIHAARFHHYVRCAKCNGIRLNEYAMACRVGNQTFADVCALPISALNDWTQGFADGQQISNSAVEEALIELTWRLKTLNELGLGYLTLLRSAKTLSGGELQRIHLSRCLGSALTETLYCLDEPSVGLHSRDSTRLLRIVRELCELGNSVVMVEHDRQIIKGADWLVEIGPGAGANGGAVVAAGKPGEVLREKSLLGGQAPGLSEVPLAMRRITEFLELKGVTTNNLNVDSVKIPLNALTVVCGVSGSGKTSLIHHTLYPLVKAKLSKGTVAGLEVEAKAKSIGPESVLKRLGDIEMVSQSPLGRSSRSTIATYLGVMDELRKIFAAEPEAIDRGLTAGSFSFNTPGGRCETCRGLGTVVEDLSFLGEMDVVCSDCNGKRFSDDVLSVLYRGKNLVEVLQMTAGELRTFLHDRPKITKLLDAVDALGLSYVTLGQSTSSFSGGEAQRLKLVELFGDIKGQKMLIFDEPTTGLSDRDVAQLLDQLRRLVAKGHTVVVVEHHLGVIRGADWVIELGPESGPAGGNVVYAGQVAGLLAVKESRTAPYLRES
jgi:excinuclease ABC subunit A